MFVLLRQMMSSCLIVVPHSVVETWARSCTYLMCNLLHTNTGASVDLSSRFKLQQMCYIDNNNKHWGRHPELLTLLAKSTDSYKGSVRWRQSDKWRERKRKRDNMKREAGRILQWHSWCSRCSRPASDYARRLSFCLPACHPICQFSRDREAVRGAEMSAVMLGRHGGNQWGTGAPS